MQDSTQKRKISKAQKTPLLAYKLLMLSCLIEVLNGFIGSMSIPQFVTDLLIIGRWPGLELDFSPLRHEVFQRAVQGTRNFGYIA